MVYLSLENIEALASVSETNSSNIACYESISNDGSGNQTHVTYCGGCTAKLCKSWSNKYVCN